MNLHTPIRNILPASVILIASFPAAACRLSDLGSANGANVDPDSYGHEVMARIIESFDEALDEEGGDAYADPDSIKPEVAARIVESFDEEC